MALLAALMGHLTGWSGRGRGMGDVPPTADDGLELQAPSNPPRPPSAATPPAPARNCRLETGLLTPGSIQPSRGCMPTVHLLARETCCRLLADCELPSRLRIPSRLRFPS